MTTWDTVIGLEVHAQLKTKSKLFSATATAFGAAPNTQTSFIDAGLPGVLPVLNKEVVSMAILFGLAVKATINPNSYFERKNYFYPDLPKGYQISQYLAPIVSDGFLMIPLPQGEEKKVSIVRAHLEEDAGKSLHDSHSLYTGIDLNRAGAPLLEIVTAPCLSSAEEVVTYLKQLHQLVRFLGICDGNMQEGSFRCDVNISLKPKGATSLGVRTELKNLNSFRFIEKAIFYEQARHQKHLEQGLPLEQETRLYCPDTNTTQPLRTKEMENDYRYFTDPDLLPIQISIDTLNQLREQMPPLPQQIKQSLEQCPELSIDDIQFLLSTPATYHFFKAVQQRTVANEKTIINWLKGPYLALLNEQGLDFDSPPISAESLAILLDHMSNQTLSSHMAKKVFNELMGGHINIDQRIQEVIEKQDHSTSHLEQLADQIIAAYPKQAADYRSGKEKLLAFFVGQLMKETKGQANPEAINRLLKQRLS